MSGMDDPEDEQGAELVMPFVSVASMGGPWDDDAYAAGWEMGQLDQVLAPIPGANLAGPTQGEEHTVAIRSGNADQADLIAMRHGWKARFEDSGVEGWVFATFRFSRQAPDEAAS